MNYVNLSLFSTAMVMTLAVIFPLAVVLMALLVTVGVPVICIWSYAIEIVSVVSKKNRFHQNCHMLGGLCVKHMCVVALTNEVS